MDITGTRYRLVFDPILPIPMPSPNTSHYVKHQARQEAYSIPHVLKIDYISPA